SGNAVLSKQASTTVSAFSSNFANVVSVIRNGSILSANDTVSTGCSAALYSADGSTVIEQKQIAVVGDPDGDGYITVNDYTLMKHSFKNPTFSLSGEFALAADTDGNGRFTSTDYIIIKRIVRGTYYLT
ncbi:MAG: dockerin type I repeat-containing protein, partial [Clostridia bacterium]|nr:dockerin type I repeat-containing protein [Clostridia bacterium]